MRNPFPGMNPYLEQPELWHQVHNRLIVAIADNLTPQIVPKYRVSIEERVYSRVPIPEQVTERFLEVRSTNTGAVISVIEILSPKNKRSKEGREAYERKRQKIIGSATNLVEIDLLRLGDPMPVLGVTGTGYRILVSPGWCRPDADLYTFSLKDPIPPFLVPLRQGESELVVDLQRLLNEVYERARFDLAIDYSQPVKPALPSEEATWVAKILEKTVNAD